MEDPKTMDGSVKTSLGVQRIEGVLHFGGVPVPELAETYGTPLYVYDLAWIRHRYQHSVSRIPNVKFVAYSVKTNANLAVLKTLASLGAGADVVSQGELRQALRAKIPPDKIVFAGVGKTPEELDLAAATRIFAIHVENPGELEYLAAHHPGTRVGIRVNPDVFPHTLQEIATGSGSSKFGFPLDQVLPLYRRFREKLRFVGLHFHLGSQIRDAAPYLEAIEKVRPLLDALDHPEYLDIGGGFFLDYQQSWDEATFWETLSPVLADLPVPVIVEPGRTLLAQAGILVTRVLYVKEMKGIRYAIVDAGMNDFVRPALYKQIHRIVCAEEAGNSQILEYAVVGPICENTDMFARSVRLERLEPGDLLVILDTGAYGYVMASNYNLRPRPPEVVVEEGHHRLVHPREQVPPIGPVETG